ncbi:hypothetical protein FIBSPDRAFT_506684 [Athelia psychrophila]|uniref:Uncharacterized protein n=1 Tax=Athelia psychrophila TaxID=1759441 RepID=A0A166K031_9AGAM|nr:hypothetical protein FIBSPDRAFT_506684 [Fibularhizoctonia sp. CBS 109695]
MGRQRHETREAVIFHFAPLMIAYIGTYHLDSHYTGFYHTRDTVSGTGDWHSLCFLLNILLGIWWWIIEYPGPRAISHYLGVSIDFLCAISTSVSADGDVHHLNNLMSRR